METNKYIDESKLVDLLKGKSKHGLEYIYDNYSDALFGVIYTIVRDNAIAEDILQDSFVKIWKKSDHYDSSKGRLYTWMLNIARNSAIDYVRSKHHKKSKKVQSLDYTVHSESDVRSEINEETIGVGELVNKLEPKYRSLIDKVYFEGYTQQEVSDEFDIPLGTVKTRIRKAISQLRTVFIKSE